GGSSARIVSQSLPASPVRRGLDSVELRVLAALGEEGFVGSRLYHSGAVQDDDEVGHSHGAEAVGDEEGDAAVDGRLAGGSCGASSRRRRVALEEGVLGLGVEGRRGLVEDEEERAVAHEAARERQLLPLSEAQLRAAGPGGAEL